MTTPAPGSTTSPKPSSPSTPSSSRNRSPASCARPTPQGKRAADGFWGPYGKGAGGVEALRGGQAFWVANDMRWVGYWVAGSPAAGLGPLPPPLPRRRLRAFARHVLADL